MVEQTGICSICGGVARPAYNCILCGSLCCANCFVAELGLCKRCAAKAKR